MDRDGILSCGGTGSSLPHPARLRGSNHHSQAPPCSFASQMCGLEALTASYQRWFLKGPSANKLIVPPKTILYFDTLSNIPVLTIEEIQWNGI